MQIEKSGRSVLIKQGTELPRCLISKRDRPNRSRQYLLIGSESNIVKIFYKNIHTIFISESLDRISFWTVLASLVPSTFIISSLRLNNSSTGAVF